MLIRDDRETEQIGKLIDAGCPELAASSFRSRWRYQFLMRALTLIPFMGVAAWHFMKAW